MVVPVLLKYGADVNYMDNDLLTPMYYARSRQVAELLLTNGAKVNAENPEGTTPLHVAAEFCYLGLIQVLVEFGADINGNGITSAEQLCSWSTNQPRQETPSGSS